MIRTNSRVDRRTAADDPVQRKPVKLRIAQVNDSEGAGDGHGIGLVRVEFRKKVVREGLEPPTKGL